MGMTLTAPRAREGLGHKQPPGTARPAGGTLNLKKRDQTQSHKLARTFSRRCVRETVLDQPLPAASGSLLQSSYFYDLYFLNVFFLLGSFQYTPLLSQSQLIRGRRSMVIRKQRFLEPRVQGLRQFPATAPRNKAANRPESSLHFLESL